MLIYGSRRHRLFVRQKRIGLQVNWFNIPTSRTKEKLNDFKQPVLQLISVHPSLSRHQPSQKKQKIAVVL